MDTATRQLVIGGIDMSSEIPLMGTTEEQLSIVNEAIYAILKGGQSYKIGTRQLQRADLSLLMDMQLKLQSKIANSGRSSLLNDTVVAVFDGR